MKGQYKIIRCGVLYDGITEEWKRNQNILVDGALIAAVGRRFPIRKAQWKLICRTAR